MEHIQKVSVKRFKNIRQVSFKTDKINVFVGSNNSGKSTLAQILHFGVSILQAIELNNKWGKKERKAVSFSPSQLLYSPCVDLYSLGYGGRLTENKNEAIELSINLENGEKIDITIQKGRNGNILVSVNNVPEAKKLSQIDKPYTIYSPGLAGIARNERLISKGVLLRTIARGDANLVLRNILYRLSISKNKTDWENFLEDMRIIFPNINLTVKFNEATDENILVFSDTGSGNVPIELAGTGVLQSIQILSYVHYFHPSIIILDEPDSHLHPNNQRLLCRLLQSVSEDREIQLFLTTHSRHVIDALNTEANFLWINNGTVEIMKEGYDISLLLDLGALDINERLSSTPNTKCIVLTEDANTTLLETLLEASGFNLKETIILSYNGCTSPHSLSPLLNMIRKSNKDSKIIVHRDRDYLDDNEVAEWEVKIRNLKVIPFVTEGTDIESYFINADHLSLLNKKSAKYFAGLIETATNLVNECSVQKYVNGRVDISRKLGKFSELNIGKLATEAPKMIDSNPQRFRHSKTVLKKLRNLFKEAHGNNLKIDYPSRYLEVQVLKDVSKTIW